MANFSYAASFLANQNPPIPLDLAEVGPAIDLPEGSGNLGGVFGIALWIADMLLHGMSIGIRRINYQQILGARWSLWQPSSFDSEEGHVKPGYYGALFAAEFRGREEGVRVSEVEVDGMGGKLSAYEAWSAKGDLLRVAIVNMAEWNGGNETRRNVTVQFGAPQGWEKVEVRRLESSTGVEDSGEDISYAGVTYTFANKGQGERSGNGTETMIVNGSVTVKVNASEAVMISKAI
ncbi:MAG: hypothetical protein M1820_007053 [Bogoriella megaspora]|nr:MAG: hypothetical protein M1820_007053 [Bogoriella megaspora]